MPYIGNQPTQIAFVSDLFSGNASTTAFTISVAPANTASVLVAIHGVLQDPTTYSVSGNTLTFSSAPPSGTGNISIRYLGIPASGVTTTAYRTVTEFTATSGQTTFTPPSYTAGFIAVYRNGIRLGASDYTASNGTTVVLAVGAVTGDLITIESFYVSSVLNSIPNTAGSVTSLNIQTGVTLSSPIITGSTPQITTYTSGSGTYTVPTNARYLQIIMVGGGAGGWGSGTSGATSGGTGGTTSFGSNSAAGGNPGSSNNSNGGVGGTATLSGAIGIALQGGQGGPSAYIQSGSGNWFIGGQGGSSALGGGGSAGAAGTAGTAGVANTGGGGGGGASNGTSGTNTGPGGGAGGYINAIITSPASTYSYAVGAAGTAGGAGANGYAGAAGGSGVIMITAFF